MMKPLAAFIGAVAGCIGDPCKSNQDCYCTNNAFALICQITKIGTNEAGKCVVPEDCDGAKAAVVLLDVDGTSVECKATYLATAAMLLALGSQV